MSCSDLPTWYLRHRIAVLDVRSAPFRRAREEVLPSGRDADVCLRRLVKADKIRRIRGGLYVVRDPVRETPQIAVASGVLSSNPTVSSSSAGGPMERLSKPKEPMA